MKLHYYPETGFVYQLAGDAANAIGLVFDPHNRFFQVINELDLAAGHLAELLTLHAHAAIFHGHVAAFVQVAAFILAGDEALQVSQLFLGRFQLFHDQLTELVQLNI